MHVTLFPLILCVAFAGCVVQPTQNAFPVLHAIETAQYAVVLEDAGVSSEWGTISIQMLVGENGVTQHLKSERQGNLDFDVKSLLDKDTGEILHRSDEDGVTYPVGAEAQLPSLAENYVLEPVTKTPIVWAIHGAAWLGAAAAWQPGELAWGKWQGHVERDENGIWINATTLCDADCTALPPVWQTNSLFQDFFLPIEMRLASSTKSHAFRLVATEFTFGGEEIEIRPRQPQLTPRFPIDARCMPLPCEGSLPPILRFADAFEALQQTSDWQNWQQSHPNSQLDTLAFAHRPEGSTAAGPLPLNGTTWIFRFQSREGPVATFTMRSFDAALGRTPPLLAVTDTQDSSSLTPFVTFDAAFASASDAIGSALEPTLQANIMNSSFSVLLDVGYGGITPEPLARSKWFVTDLETGATTVAAGYDGRLIGEFPHFAPPHI